LTLTSLLKDACRAPEWRRWFSIST